MAAPGGMSTGKLSKALTRSSLFVTDKEGAGEGQTSPKGAATLTRQNSSPGDSRAKLTRQNSSAPQGRKSLAGSCARGAALPLGHAGQ